MSQSSELGRSLNALRRKEQKVCARCGKTFEGIRQAKYCSPACGTGAYWDSHRAELNRKRRERYRKERSEA
jgi:hypothetical protein